MQRYSFCRPAGRTPFSVRFEHSEVAVPFAESIPRGIPSVRIRGLSMKQVRNLRLNAVSARRNTPRDLLQACLVISLPVSWQHAATRR